MKKIITRIGLGLVVFASGGLVHGAASGARSEDPSRSVLVTVAECRTSPLPGNGIVDTCDYIPVNCVAAGAVDPSSEMYCEIRRERKAQRSVADDGAAAYLVPL